MRANSACRAGDENMRQRLNVFRQPEGTETFLQARQIFLPGSITGKTDCKKTSADQKPKGWEK